MEGRMHVLGLQTPNPGTDRRHLRPGHDQGGRRQDRGVQLLQGSQGEDGRCDIERGRGRMTPRHPNCPMQFDAQTIF